MIRRACAACLVLVVGCAPPASTARVRDLQLPAQFDGAAAGRSLGSVDWRAFFADDNLSALVATALAENLDLKIALQRIEIARAGVTSATGARLPRLAFATSAAVRKYGTYTMDGAGNAATEITPGERVPVHLPDLFVGFQAAWEVDLWGRLGKLAGAARTRYLATIEGTNLIVTNLVADIAALYFELVALDRVQDILAQTLARQTQALDIMRLEKQAGRTNELAVQQFEAQLAGTRALSAATLRDARRIENHINLLLGRVPQPIARTKTILDRPVAATVSAGVPSDLLRNRPDIRQAELAIVASRFDLAAARAAFYPRLDISATLGYQAFDPRFLFRTPASLAYSVLAGLVAPVVNRRGIEAAFSAAEAAQLEAMYSYQRTVLTSFVEVATALHTLHQAAEIAAQHRHKRAAAAETIATADALFRAGKATYLDVLLAEQNTLAAELDLVSALRDQHVASIRLYKALGGGWQGALKLER